MFDYRYWGASEGKVSVKNKILFTDPSTLIPFTSSHATLSTSPLNTQTLDLSSNGLEIRLSSIRKRSFFLEAV